MAVDAPARLRVGTRGSALALWQADHVIARIHEVAPDTVVSRIVLSTLGDRVIDVPLARIGDKGLFTREIEDALRSGAVDVAVHSLKDLPTTDAEGLEIGAVLAREDASDVVVSPRGYTLQTLPVGALVGTSSLRRRAQLLAVRPDLRITDLRGNVPTRLSKLQTGEYAATVMARAGLLRLGLTEHVTQVLGPGEMLPAVGQGALAIQSRRGDPALASLLRTLDHRETRIATTAERTLMKALEGGCQVPIAALATIAGDVLHLRALVADTDGREVMRDEISGPIADAVAAADLGQRLASRLIASGAAGVLDRVRVGAESASIQEN